MVSGATRQIVEGSLARKRSQKFGEVQNLNNLEDSNSHNQNLRHFWHPFQGYTLTSLFPSHCCYVSVSA